MTVRELILELQKMVDETPGAADCEVLAAGEAVNGLLYDPQWTRVHVTDGAMPISDKWGPYL